MTPSHDDIDTDLELELFGRQLPLSPSVKPLVRKCIVCGMAYERAKDAAHRLCGNCAEAAPDVKALIEKEIAALTARMDALNERWIAHQANIEDDEVADRWSALCANRAITEGRVRDAETGRRAGSAGADAAVLTNARRDLARLTAKIARTRQAGGALADLLAAEEAFLARKAQIWQEIVRAEMALSDVEAVLEPPPF